ncbi:Uncharacterised protein [Moraxella lacunata]|uniref:Uncharacterized protein n=1 Tax=Moraxella lacunata TaxID=477 RepID=A0A378TSV0_MORLA|nr:hypothetical protein [Moraxella lacunata]STZ63909.1 Uncharacterised protein [Moraxella lacunata]
MKQLTKELMMAQINKLNAETNNIQSTSELNNTKIQAELLKLIAETQKIQKETRYYPLIGVVIATIALIAAIASPIITHLLTK